MLRNILDVWEMFHILASQFRYIECMDCVDWSDNMQLQKGCLTFFKIDCLHYVQMIERSLPMRLQDR